MTWSSFHGLTTQMPHETWLAVDRKARKPKVTYPPIRVLFFSGPVFQEGIEIHRIMEQDVRRSMAIIRVVIVIF
jgi:hypothetical protein